MQFDQLRRREFITLLGGAMAAWPLAARAQQQALPVIGFMSARAPEDSTHLLAAFRRGLAEGGYVEGQNLSIEFRWARGQYDLLPAMAAELINRRVLVLTTAGGEPSALAAKRATSTIPIVFGVGDPVSEGLVESFNRPGGNATGDTLYTSLMEQKRLGLLRELVPGVPLIGVLLNPTFAPGSRQLQQVEEAARSIDQRIVVVNPVFGLPPWKKYWRRDCAHLVPPNVGWMQQSPAVRRRAILPVGSTGGIGQ